MKERIEIYEGPDRQGRYHYALLWVNARGEPKGQHFRSNPYRHGVPADRIKDLRTGKPADF